MHLRNTLVIPFYKAKQDFGVNTPGVLINMPHDSKIEGHNISATRHFKISLMHVRVEEAIAKSMVQKHMQDPITKLTEVMTSCS